MKQKTKNFQRRLSLLLIGLLLGTLSAFAATATTKAATSITKNSATLNASVN